MKASTIDGNTYVSSSAIPLNVENGKTDDDEETNMYCGHTSLIGRGWYTDIGYANGIIRCVPQAPVSGVHVFEVKVGSVSSHLNVSLDKTHHIPAVGPWPEQPMTTGTVLFDEDGDFDRFFPVVVDTTALSNGWHSLGVRSRSEDSDTSVCGWCGDELHFTSGTAKIWFYVDNPPPDSPPAPSTASDGVELQGTWAGTSSGSLLVTTTDTVPAVIDDLYIVTVASKSYEVVAGVAGLGLDWVLVGAQCGGRDQTGTTVFAGHGTPTVAMPITAVFMDEPNNAAIAVQRYSGTSTFDPVGATVSGNTNGVFAGCSGGDDDNVYSFDLATSDGAVAFSAAAMRYREHSVTAPWTELLEFHHGSSVGDQVGLAISVHALDPLDPTAGVSVTGLLSGNVDYAVVAFEIRPTGDEPPPGDDPPADDPPPDDPPPDDPPPDDPPGDDPPPVPATLVIHEGTWTGSSAGVVDVDTDGPVPAVDGDLYLVSIASKPYRKVTSVMGLGLEWTLVDEQCGGRHQTAVTVFMARGATGGPDQVTASMEDDPKNAVIAVSRYSGVSANDPMGTVVSVNTNGVDASCNSGDDDDEYAVDLVPSGATGMVFSAVAMRMRDHDPDTGWTEHVEVNRGSRSGDRAGLAVSERPIAGAAEVAVNGRFSRSVDYAVIGLELRSVADDLDLPPALGVRREGVWTGSARRDEVVQTTSRVQAVDGDLYLVAIASKPYEPVDAVEGLGLSWFRAVEQCAGRHQTGVTVFVAMGTTSGDGVITARMDDDPKNALITVLRYSGIDPDDPIAFVASANTNGISGGCDGGSDGPGYAYEMAPASASGVLVTAAAMRMRGHTPGPGWTEVAETHRGRRTGEEAGLSVSEYPVDGTLISIDGEFTGSVDWAAIAIEIR